MTMDQYVMSVKPTPLHMECEVNGTECYGSYVWVTLSDYFIV